jgi:hypothetical protein
MADFPASEVYSADFFGNGLQYSDPSTYGAQVIYDFGSNAPAVTTTYGLAAYDSASRRYWSSTTIDFASAPAPVGAWQTATLTVLSSWTT